MQHSDFLNDPNCRQYNWRLTDWSSALRIVFGGRALLFFRGAFAVVLVPVILLAVYGSYSSRPTLLILVFLSFGGFWTSSTRPTGIGMVANLLIALIGFVSAVMRHDILLAVSAMLPGLTWFGSCMILGTTSSYLADALRKSEALFQMLYRRGILTAVPNQVQ